MMFILTFFGRRLPKFTGQIEEQLNSFGEGSAEAKNDFIGCR